jgi:TPR repeat protein
MRTFLFCLALTVAGAANADALADANKLLETKSYAEALPIFNMLANAGNPEAQLRLGEMFWYGEDVAVDRARADALFAKAAAGGSKAAIAAAKLSGERELHKDDIAFWTSKYDGAELRAGKYECKAPQFPAVSKKKDEIKAVGDRSSEWLNCFNGFADMMADSLPPGKRLPPAIVVLMSEPEIMQAKVNMDKVYATVQAKAQAEAELVITQRDAWTAATSAYVEEENKATIARTKQAKIDMDNSMRMHNSSLNNNRDVAPARTR